MSSSGGDSYQAGVQVLDPASGASPNVAAGSTNQDALMTACARLEVPFSTTAVQAVGTTDVSNFKTVSVQVNSQGASSTVTFQVSNDNVNWTSCALSSPAVTGSSAQTNVTAANVVYAGPLNARYFRLNVTGIASGTTAGVIEFFSSTWAGLTIGTTTTLQSSTTSAIGGLAANVSGGCSLYSNTALSNTAVAVKASAGNLYGYSLGNPNASAVYVQFFNLAVGSVTPGTTAPTAVVMLQANQTLDVGLTVAESFATAVTICATTTPTGGTAPGTALAAKIRYM